MSSRLPPLAPFLAALAIFAVFLGIHSRNNDFPFFYHTDEPSKVQQILSGERNGRHPTLLLSSAKLLLSGQPPTSNAAAQAGRWSSAVFAAAAISLLFLWAQRQIGWAGGVLAVILAGLQPPLLTAAHFVKEDPALLLGLAATLYGALLFSEKPGPPRAFGLGLGAGLAVSGKWIGLAAVVIAAVQIALTLRSQKRPGTTRLWLFFVIGIVAIFSATNLDLLLHWRTIQSGVSSEVTSFYATDAGGARGFYLLHYAARLPEVFYWPLIVLAAWGGWRIWREPASGHLRLFSLVPLAWFLMISSIPKTENRYLLPISTCLALLAAIGVAKMRRPWLTGAAIFLVGGLLAPGYLTAMGSFRHDHRAEMAAWIASHLPPTAMLVEDAKVGLPLSGDARFDPNTKTLPQLSLFTGETYASDYGSVAELRARGVTHVALFVSNYLVFLERGGQKANTSQTQLAAAFYQELKTRAKPVFTRAKGFDRYLNPALVLYELPAETDSSGTLKNR